MRALGISKPKRVRVGEEGENERSLGFAESSPLPTVLCSGGGHRRTVPLQRSEATSRGLGVEVQPPGKRRRHSPPRFSQLSPRDGLWSRDSPKEGRRTGDKRKAKEGEGSSVGSVQHVVVKSSRKRRKKGEKEEKEEKTKKESQGNGGQVEVDLEGHKSRPKLQATQSVVKQAESDKLNRGHSGLRRGSAVSGNPAGAEDSQVLSRTAEQAGLEGSEKLPGLRCRRVRKRACGEPCDAQVLPSSTAHFELDQVDAERVSHSVHCDRFDPGGPDFAQYGRSGAETQSHRDGFQGCQLGSRRKDRDHQGKVQSVLSSRSELSPGRSQAREKCELGNARPVDPGRLERKRRKRRLDERRSEEGLERRERGGEGLQGRRQEEGAAKRSEDRSATPHVASPPLKVPRVKAEVYLKPKTESVETFEDRLTKPQFCTRVFQGSLPVKKRKMVAGLSKESCFFPKKLRKGTNESFIDPILSCDGSFYKEGLPVVHNAVAGPEQLVNSPPMQRKGTNDSFLEPIPSCVGRFYKKGFPIANNLVVGLNQTSTELGQESFECAPNPSSLSNNVSSELAGTCEKKQALAAFEPASSVVGATAPRGSKSHAEPDTHVCMIQAGFAVAGHMLELVENLAKPPPSQKFSHKVGREDPIFPLPIPPGPMVLEGGTGFKDMKVTESVEGWFLAVILGLNSLYGARNPINQQPPTKAQQKVLSSIRARLSHLKRWIGQPVSTGSWASLLQGKSVNAYGEEIGVAQRFQWENLVKSLPEKGSVVPLTEVCRMGMLHYVQNPHAFLKPCEERKHFPAPPVRVNSEHWEAVARGLIQRNICSTIPLADVLHVEGKPLLSGMFGVTKNEQHGPFEVLRLIMDLRPLNSICVAVTGDTETLPLVSQLMNLELVLTDDLVVSSEDLKAMFYCFELDRSWYKLLGFNKVIPPCLNPPGDSRPHVLCARVLPMGFINSVAIAQHLHRNVVHLAANRAKVPEANELRRNAPWPEAEPLFRIYLDNFDLLQGSNKEMAQAIEGSSPVFVEALRTVYEELGLPRNLKKSVESSRFAEIQGAEIDGVLGCATPKLSKLARYLAIALKFLRSSKCTQKQVQICAGGLVYVAMYQRPLMSCLNRIWTFITSFSRFPHQEQQIPQAVKREVLTFLCLLPLAQISFRCDWSCLATASDASEQGGGVTVSTKLTGVGLAASTKAVRGEYAEKSELQGVLVVSLFDGIGALRVALDVLKVPVSGYVSVERDQSCQRVLDSFFPSALHVEHVEQVSRAMVKEWATLFSRTSMVLVGGGPPCQGVSQLNALRLGAVEDSRSNLVVHFPRIVSLVKECFPWAQVYTLCESVFSMSGKDREFYTRTLNVLPYMLDAGDVSLARRERLYWFDWEIPLQPGCAITNPDSSNPLEYGQVHLECVIQPADFLEPGWRLLSPDRMLSTFTTAQPAVTPRKFPAGINLCNEADLNRWSADRHRFPPFQYQWKNGLTSASGSWRLPSIQEREAILGFPRDYTVHAWSKGRRQQDPQGYEDLRLSLLGNTWSIPVVAILLQSLFHQHGFVPSRSIQSVVDLCSPGKASDLASYLLRMPFRVSDSVKQEPVAAQTLLVKRLSSLVSNKGTDILLLSSSVPVPSFHRFRTSVPSRLWRWRTVCSWHWRRPGCHINYLELSAFLTTVKWRVVQEGLTDKKFFHLIDSLVSLYIANKGRSSSKKLRLVMYRLSAWLLAANLQPCLAYVSSQTNPADRPSRVKKRHVKFKWRPKR